MRRLSADVAFARAIDGVTDSHVISGDGLGNRAGGAADVKEPAGDFLAGADLGEGAVALGVQIDLKGLLVRINFFIIHGIHKMALSAGKLWAACICNGIEAIFFSENTKLYL